MPINPNDYYLVTSKTAEHPPKWTWEIQRKSQPLGVKMIASGFQSDSAAQFAGKKALADFLSELVKEDKRVPMRNRPPQLDGAGPLKRKRPRPGQVARRGVGLL